MVERMKLTVNGTAYTGAERWAFGLWFGFGGSSSVTPTEVQAFATAVAGSITALSAPAFMAEWSTATFTTGVAVQYYADGPTATYSGAAPLAAPKPGSSTVSAPPQAARCVSLVTGIAGRRFRGRMYLPAAGASISASGISNPPANYVTSLASWLGSLDSLWAGDDAPYIGVYSAAADVVTPVTAIRVGNVLDTQRRRRDSIPETYVAASI